MLTTTSLENQENTCDVIPHLIGNHDHLVLLKPLLILMKPANENDFSIMYAQLLIKTGIRTLFSFRIENAMNNVVYFWEYIYFSPYKEMHIACWADNSIYVCLHE